MALRKWLEADLTGRPIQLLVPERYRVRCQDLVAGCLTGTKVRRLGDQSMFFGRRRGWARNAGRGDAGSTRAWRVGHDPLRTCAT